MIDDLTVRIDNINTDYDMYREGKHNAHVLTHYRRMCVLGEWLRKPLMQLHYYTMYQLEKNPNWKPK